MASPAPTTRTVVAVGCATSATVAVIDFSDPQDPTGFPGGVDPAYPGGPNLSSVVAIQGSRAVAGNLQGGQARLIDVTDPSAPALKGVIDTGLQGIASIAVRGSQVAVGEGNGGRIALAKQRGAYKGRKKSLSEASIVELRQRVSSGDTKVQVARDFGISRETLYQYLRAAA